MSERGEIRYGDASIGYEVIRSPRRKKTVEITIDGQAGVLVAAPVRVPQSEIEAIVRKRAPWIVRKASDATFRAGPKEFVSGESLPYLGRQVRMTVEAAAVKRVEVEFRYWSFKVLFPASLQADERRDAIRRAFVGWYGARAGDRLTARVAYWAPLVGQKPRSVLIRAQKQRWASCAPDGTLRFNWRIVLAEPALIDYVVVHELMHLGIRQHSREFWQRVASVMPDYALRRRRLQEVGPYLSF